MKNNYTIAFRSLFKKGRLNGIKVLSLGVGLAMGLVLVSKVCFELFYDNFYPDGDRIYQIRENFGVGEHKLEGNPTTSGGVAVGMRDEIPEVEAATRIERMGDDHVFFTADKRKYNADCIMADSCFFDVLPRKMRIGDAKQILSRPLYAMVSERLAKRLGKKEEVIGLAIEMNSFPGRRITIDGIFEDVPENSHLRYDMILSLSSSNALYGWDCLNEWMGCDRFCSYVKLKSGADKETVEAEMARMLDRHVDPESLKKEGIKYQIVLEELADVYSGQPATRQMAVMLSLIAFVLLFAAVMNYVLIVISSLVARTKEIAVHKCYGASGKNVAGMIFSETLVHLILSLIVAGLLVLAFRGTVEEIVKASLAGLFTARACAVLGGVCFLVFVLSGLIPSQLFMRIPVASTFRSFKETRRAWKKALLCVQFAASSFLVALLMVIGLQYERMIHDRPGYTYENVIYGDFRGIDRAAVRTAMKEIERLPEVAGVSTCFNLPIFCDNGDLVFRPNSDESILHFADLYEIDAEYVPLMEISILQGKNFDVNTADSAQVLMSKLMAEKLCGLLGWQDGIVGKNVEIGGHQAHVFTVVGVYDNIRIGSIADKEARPSALFYSRHPNNVLLVKLREMNPENMKKVDDVLKRVLPDKEVALASYKASMTNLYKDARLFRDAVMWGGVVTLIITLIGLIGYTNDEIGRRSKEIAVRKINGATLKDILKMISADAMYMAVPAVLFGVIGAYLAGEKWLEQFAEKIPLSFWIFAGSALAVLGIVCVTVILRTYSVANENPVHCLKNE